MLGQARRKPFRHICGVKGLVKGIARATAKIGWVEEHQIKAFTLHCGEEIALAHLYPIFDLVEQRVDTSAAHSGRVDIYRYHPACP
jgi:hypothetical protein